MFFKFDEFVTLGFTKFKKLIVSTLNYKFNHLLCNGDLEKLLKKWKRTITGVMGGGLMGNKKKIKLFNVFNNLQVD